MSETTSIRVNFGKPIAFFPLAAVSLVPHGVVHLHIFEPRYRQMVSDALDGAGQIAMAVFDGTAWQEEYHARPPVREMMCVGQIVAHEALADGRFNIALQGVCRARVLAELPPDEDRLYRVAMLDPVSIEEVDDHEMKPVRLNVMRLLSKGSLRDLRDAETMVRHLKDPEIPTAAILELVGFSLIQDPEQKYALLAEANLQRRADMVQDELRSLKNLLDLAQPQRGGKLPRGCTWN